MMTSREIRELKLEFERREEAARRRAEHLGAFVLRHRLSPRALPGLAAALLMGVVALWAWRPQTAPNAMPAEAPPLGVAFDLPAVNLPIGVYDTH